MLLNFLCIGSNTYRMIIFVLLSLFGTKDMEILKVAQAFKFYTLQAIIAGPAFAQLEASFHSVFTFFVFHLLILYFNTSRQQVFWLQIS